MQKKAFTLTELLVGVIILGIATASIVPVVSKKMLKTEKEAKNRAYVSYDCKTVLGDDSKCTLCDKKHKDCYICELKCTAGSYKNFDKCVCVSCAIFDEKCSLCDKNGCLVCQNGYTLVDGKCQVVTSNSSTTESGLVCQNGYTLVDGKCQVVTIDSSTTESVTGNGLLCEEEFEAAGYDQTYIDCNCSNNCVGPKWCKLVDSSGEIVTDSACANFCGDGNLYDLNPSPFAFDGKEDCEQTFEKATCSCYKMVDGIMQNVGKFKGWHKVTGEWIE